MRALACLLVVLAGCATQASPTPAADAGEALLHEPGLHPYALAVDGGQATGLLAVPPGGQAQTLVVLAKGLGTPASAWTGFMEELAGRGALAVAMEYRGGSQDWKVRAAVADTLAATQAIQRAHPELQRTVLYGVSMGGEATGLLLARAPPHTFTHWLSGAGVADLRSEWQAAASFRLLIEAEAGGSPDQAPDAYTALSPVEQAPAIAAQGLRRAYFVHGLADLVVPLEQADRMANALARAGVPVTYTVLATEPGAWACTPLIITCSVTPGPNAPAGHEAGVSPVALDIVRDLVAGRPEPTQPFQRIVVEGRTGASAAL